MVKEAVETRWDNTNYGDKNVFDKVMHLRDDLKEQYKTVMDLEETDSMTFKDAYKYADLVFSQLFEGNK